MQPANKEGLTFYAAFYPPLDRLELGKIIKALPDEADRALLTPKNLVPPVHSGERRKEIEGGKGGWAVFPRFFDPTIDVEVIADGKTIFLQEGKPYQIPPEFVLYVPPQVEVDNLVTANHDDYSFDVCYRALQIAGGNQNKAQELLDTWDRESKQGQDTWDNNPYGDNSTVVHEGPLNAFKRAQIRARTSPINPKEYAEIKKIKKAELKQAKQWAREERLLAKKSARDRKEHRRWSAGLPVKMRNDEEVEK